MLLALLPEGRPVVVHGEAGVGKTALVRAAVEATELKLVEAGALATLSWLPYLPLRRPSAGSRTAPMRPTSPAS